MTTPRQTESGMVTSYSSEKETRLERSFTTASFSRNLGREPYVAYPTNNCIDVRRNKEKNDEGTWHD